MALINGIYIHVTKESISREADVSSHSAEEGIDITDTIRVKPKELSITGKIVGYSEYSAPESQNDNTSIKAWFSLVKKNGSKFDTMSFERLNNELLAFEGSAQWVDTGNVQFLDETLTPIDAANGSTDVLEVRFEVSMPYGATVRIQNAYTEYCAFNIINTSVTGYTVRDYSCDDEISDIVLSNTDNGVPGRVKTAYTNLYIPETQSEANAVLDFEYEIPFDDDLIPNEAEITLYNLSAATIANFKKGNELTITSGYGSDMGIVLRGKISKVSTKRDDLDKVTTVYVLDNYDYGDATIIEEAFGENTKASYILKSLLDRLGLPIEVFKVQRDHTYESATTLKGSITENLKTYADVCGVSVWLSKRRIYCRPVWDGDNIHFTISPSTGLIGSPEPFAEENTSEEYKDSVTGYNVEMLAQHRMTTAANLICGDCHEELERRD